MRRCTATPQALSWELLSAYVANPAAPLLRAGHVFCEQAITKNTAHPFCIRQYASFQDKYHLYFLFDLMNGGDLMDVLVTEATVIKHRVRGTGLKNRCLGQKVTDHLQLTALARRRHTPGVPLPQCVSAPRPPPACCRPGHVHSVPPCPAPGHLGMRESRGAIALVPLAWNLSLALALDWRAVPGNERALAA